MVKGTRRGFACQLRLSLLALGATAVAQICQRRYSTIKNDVSSAVEPVYAISPNILRGLLLISFILEVVLSFEFIPDLLGFLVKLFGLPKEL